MMTINGTTIITTITANIVYEYKLYNFRYKIP